MFTIYLVRNRANGKMYVGLTGRTVNRRFIQHRSEARLGSEKYFHRAIRKYGEFAFDILPIWEGSDGQKAKQTEIEIISGLRLQDPNIGYNRTAGGDGFVGVHSEKTLEKFRLQRKGQKTHLGHKHSEETKEKLRLAKLGKKQSLETAAKIGAALRKEFCRKGHPRTPKHIRINARGDRVCRTCRNANRRIKPENRKVIKKKFGSENPNFGNHKPWSEARRLAQAARNLRERLHE